MLCFWAVSCAKNFKETTETFTLGLVPGSYPKVVELFIREISPGFELFSNFPTIPCLFVLFEEKRDYGHSVGISRHFFATGAPVLKIPAELHLGNRAGYGQHGRGLNGQGGLANMITKH